MGPATVFTAASPGEELERNAGSKGRLRKGLYTGGMAKLVALQADIGQISIRQTFQLRPD
jgi:hypothetical protein